MAFIRSTGFGIKRKHLLRIDSIKTGQAGCLPPGRINLQVQVKYVLLFVALFR